MYFTTGDIKQLEQILLHRVVKDTDFDNANDFNGSELIPIVQDSENKIISFKDLAKKVASSNMSDIYNVSAMHDLHETTLNVAASMIPSGARKLGLIITYEDKDGNWRLYQFAGKSLNQWGNSSCWKDLLQLAVSQYLIDSDEEDLTKVKSGDKSVLKFKNKKYNKDEFSGLGRIHLRKNLICTEGCSVDDEDHYINILNQGMISLSNTVYIIQYDYDLQGKEIIIPKNCILSFQGGFFKNGSIKIDNTRILGVRSYNEIGNVQINGNPYVGQVMIFEESDTNFTGRLTGPNNTWNSPKIYWWDGAKWSPMLSSGEIGDITSEISKIKESIQKVSDDLDTAKKECDDKINATKSELNSSIDSAKSELDSKISSTKTELSNKITSVEGKVSSNSTKIGANTSKINSLEPEVNGIKTKVDENKASIIYVKNDLTTKIDAVDGKVDDNTNSIKEANKKISDNTSKINTIAPKVTVLESKVNDNSSKIATLEAGDITHDAAIKKVTKDFEDYKRDNPHPCNAIQWGNSHSIPVNKNGVIPIPQPAVLSEIKVFRSSGYYGNNAHLKNYNLQGTNGILDLKQFTYGVQHMPIILLSGDVSCNANDFQWHFEGSIHPKIRIVEIVNRTGDLVIEIDNCKVTQAYTSGVITDLSDELVYANSFAENYSTYVKIRVSDYKLENNASGQTSFIRNNIGMFNSSGVKRRWFNITVFGWVNG